MSTRQLRVLVTGANGFVGSALVRNMSTDPHLDVIAALRNQTEFGLGPVTETSSRATTRDNGTTQSPTCVFTGDISGNTDWQTALNDVDAIIHLAARVHVMKQTAADSLPDFRRVNVEGTLNLARQAASRGARRFVYLSSVKVYGDHGTFTERDAPSPPDSYAVSKLEAEMGLHAIAKTTGMEIVIIRPPLVYGHGVKANFRALINLVQRGVPLPFGAVHNRRSFVALDNLVSLLTTCLQHPRAAGETFLVSDGHDLSTPELLRQIGEALGKPVRLVSVPHRILQGALSLVGKKAIAERLLGTLVVDIGKARELLQWTPSTSVAEALRRTVAAG